MRPRFHSADSHTLHFSAPLGSVRRTLSTHESGAPSFPEQKKKRYFFLLSRSHRIPIRRENLSLPPPLPLLKLSAECLRSPQRRFHFPPPPRVIPTSSSTVDRASGMEPNGIFLKLACSSRNAVAAPSWISIELRRIFPEVPEARGFSTYA